MTPPPHGHTPADRLARPMRDLRISITDRCNFRCRYCMPREQFGPDHAFLPRSELLTFEELARVAEIAVSLGVRKVRLTGGEPLLRSDVPKLVAMLSALELDTALTTNGSRLAELAPALAEAGLSRVTVSLDSLDPAVFRRMNDTDVPVDKVLAGIDAAAEAGLRPVKINSVVRRGVNDGTLVDLARRFRGTGHVVRFIEFMDVGLTNGWRLDDVVSGAEIIERIAAELPLEPVAPRYPGEVARRWRYTDGSGEIGVITSVTQPFCRSCTRARLSSDGKLYTCLFSSRPSADLRTVIRSGATDEAIRGVLAEAWRAREDRYSEIRSENTRRLPRIEMSYIGG